MAIRILRSSGDNAPSSLASGQLGYVEGAVNGGQLYIGEIGGTVRAIAGKKYVDKLNTIEANAQVNAVTTVAGRVGAVTLTTADLSDFATATSGVISGSILSDLDDVEYAAPSDGQVLTWNDSAGHWDAMAPGQGVTAFIQLNDVPQTYTGQGGKFVRVNSGGTALEFVDGPDDGTF